MRGVPWWFLVPSVVALCWHGARSVVEGPSIWRSLVLAGAAGACLWAVRLRRGATPGLTGRVLASYAAAVALWLCVLEFMVFQGRPRALAVLVLATLTVMQATVLAAIARPATGNTNGARVVLRIGFVLVLTGLSFCAVEAILRVAFPVGNYAIPPDPGSPPLYEHDAAQNRLVPRPDFRGRTVHPEFPGIAVATNAWGLRDGLDEATPPAEGEASVLMLGDSMIFGLGVELGETCQEVLETLAADITERPLRVYGAGVPGYGTIHEGQMLEQVAPLLRPGPDVVVVGVLEDNDFQDNWAAEEEAVRGGENLVAGTEEPPMLRFLRGLGSLRYWSATSATMQATRAELLLVRMGLVEPVVRRNLFLDMCLSREPPELAIRMRDSVVAQLDAIRARCAELDAELLVMVIPSVIQAEPARFDAFVESVDRSPETCSRTGFHDAFVAELGARGIHVLDMLPPLEAQAADGEGGYHLEGHWNATGHRVAAEQLVPRIRALLAR